MWTLAGVVIFLCFLSPLAYAEEQRRAPAGLSTDAVIDFVEDRMGSISEASSPVEKRAAIMAVDPSLGFLGNDSVTTEQALYFAARVVHGATQGQLAAYGNGDPLAGATSFFQDRGVVPSTASADTFFASLDEGISGPPSASVDTAWHVIPDMSGAAAPVAAQAENIEFTTQIDRIEVGGMENLQRVVQTENQVRQELQAAISEVVTQTAASATQQAVQSETGQTSTGPVAPSAQQPTAEETADSDAGAMAAPALVLQPDWGSLSTVLDNAARVIGPSATAALVQSTVEYTVETVMEQMSVEIASFAGFSANAIGDAMQTKIEEFVMQSVTEVVTQMVATSEQIMQQTMQDVVAQMSGAIDPAEMPVPSAESYAAPNAAVTGPSAPATQTGTPTGGTTSAPATQAAGTMTKDAASTSATGAISTTTKPDASTSTAQIISTTTTTDTSSVTTGGISAASTSDTSALTTAGISTATTSDASTWTTGGISATIDTSFSISPSLSTFADLSATSSTSQSTLPEDLAPASGSTSSASCVSPPC